MALSDRERYTRDVPGVLHEHVCRGLTAYYQLSTGLCCWSNGYGSHILRHWYRHGFNNAGSTLCRWQIRLWWEGQSWV